MKRSYILRSERADESWFTTCTTVPMYMGRQIPGRKNRATRIHTLNNSSILIEHNGKVFNTADIDGHYNHFNEMEMQKIVNVPQSALLPFDRSHLRGCMHCADRFRDFKVAYDTWAARVIDSLIDKKVVKKALNKKTSGA